MNQNIQPAIKYEDVEALASRRTAEQHHALGRTVRFLAEQTGLGENSELQDRNAELVAINDALARQNEDLITLNESLKAENRALEERNYQLMHDRKTGLLNDVGLSEEIEKLDLSTQKCVLLIDARGLKALNDDTRYGYKAGDLMLKGVAKVLRENVDDSSVIARHGGDEFCVIFDEEDQEKAQLIADKLRALLSGAEGAVQCLINEKNGTEIFLSARIATAFAGGDTGNDVWQAVDNADEGMRLAKELEKEKGTVRGDAGSVSIVGQ